MLPQPPSAAHLPQPQTRQRGNALVSCCVVAPSDSIPEYRVGTASWTDPTLLKAGFYPPSAKSAEARLRFYADHFNTVEVDSTYYALPDERNAALWNARTPDDFRFNIKAFASLTQHHADTRALPHAVKSLLPPEALRQPRLDHPAPAVVDCCFEIFRQALEPLRQAGKLGCILFQFPPWFTARASNEAYIDFCRARMPDDRLAIEFRHPSWFNDHTRHTVDFLAERHLSLVCLDAPQAPSIPTPPYVPTAEVAYVRFHGRNRQAWFQRTTTAAERFKYLYSDDELRQVSQTFRQLRDAKVVYAIFNNCYADYGVRNASTLKRLLDEPG